MARGVGTTRGCVGLSRTQVNEGSFHKDELKDLRFDYILANPPFNTSDWGGERLREDARWKYGVPPVGDANYAWLQHILWHLAPNGTAGVVLANGSMSSAQSGEGAVCDGKGRMGKTVVGMHADGGRSGLHWATVSIHVQTPISI